MSKTAEEVEMVNVQVDGEWKKFPKGTRLIEACRKAGKFVPHYCYHPKLSSPGNCRMCLVELGMPRMGPDRKPELGEDGYPLINWIPRPQISCAQTIADGMAVRTDSELVKDCRHGVMEFLLINHPLDCPICDQAGECELQEFSVEYGTGASRFLEEKVKKPKRVELGPRVTLDAERCVLCSRCIRFCKEVADDDVLGFIDRGSHTELSAYPGKKLENNYSLNTVDICPVGALTSTDFRFKMRVWFLKETKSICTSCGTGCNTIIGSREDKVYRQTPRENEAVNSCWMCDFGRLNFHYLYDETRIIEPEVRQDDGSYKAVQWPKAIARASEILKDLPGRQLAMVASAGMTNEELFLARKLAETLEIERVDVVPHTGEADGILVSEDRNPNTNGARLMQVAAKEPGSRLKEITEGVKSGAIRGLLIWGEDPAAFGLKEADLENLEALVATSLLPNAATAQAHVRLPGAGFAEKRGSMINVNGRLQRLNRATQPPGETMDDWEILRDLILNLSGSNGLYLIEDVFKQMASEIAPLKDLTLSKISDLGVELEGLSSAGSDGKEKGKK